MARSPLPLLEWEPPLARTRYRRRRSILAATGIGLTMLGLATALDLGVRPAPRLVWNVSASAPVGLWRIRPDRPVRSGDMVLASPPAAIRRLAAERRYLPGNVPLLKRVAARGGDEVCALGQEIFVNGRWIAERRVADRRGRPLPWWSGCELLRGGRLFLLMDAPDSFDGRYFGPVDEAAVIGRATPLWLR